MSEWTPCSTIVRVRSGAWASQPGAADRSGTSSGRPVAKARACGVEEKVDQPADFVQGMVVPDAAYSGAVHVRVGTGRLVTVEDRFGQIDGCEVGEPGDRDLGQFLGRAHHIERGTDAETCVVQQAQPLAGVLRPAGQRPQFCGVTQGRDRPLGATVTVRGPLVHREQSAPREVHFVRGRPPRRQQFQHAGIKAGQVRDASPLGVERQIQQPSGLVVGQQQPTVIADDEHAFAHGVQHRVVMFVHAIHLDRAQTVGLPPKPPGHQGRPARGHSERNRSSTEDDRNLPCHHAGHTRGLHAGSHQGDDLRVIVDGDDRLHLTAERAVDPLGVHMSGQRRREGGDDPLPDQLRPGVRVADPFRVHHHDEVDARRLPPRLGERLEHPGRIRSLQRGQETR